MIKNAIAKFKAFISSKEGRFKFVKLSLLGLSMFMVLLAIMATLTIGAPPPDDPRPLVGIQPPIEVGSDIGIEDKAPVKTK